MPIEEVIFDFAKIGIENPLIQSLGIGIVRGLAGWIENAFEDGKITRPEFGKLFETMFRIIPQALGLSALGLPAVGSFFTDFLVTKITHALEKKK